jgi:ribosomal protein S18 acetylase RimI-like enzyme
MKFELRTATKADHDFLFALHSATMSRYIDRTWGWDEAWQLAQFDLHFEPGEHQLIIVAGEPAGVLQVEERPRELFVASIQILPGMQSQGIGSAVLREVMKRARDSGRPTTLQVLTVNTRARDLYERLGFRVVGENLPHLCMRYA